MPNSGIIVGTVMMDKRVLAWVGFFNISAPPGKASTRGSHAGLDKASRMTPRFHFGRTGVALGLSRYIESICRR